jgi:DNA-3-methyladenine glycosylase
MAAGQLESVDRWTDSQAHPAARLLLLWLAASVGGAGEFGVISVSTARRHDALNRCQLPLPSMPYGKVSRVCLFAWYSDFRTRYVAWRRLDPKDKPLAVEGRKLKLSSRKGSDRRLRPLPRAALPVDTEVLARYLIGKVVVHDIDSGRLSGRIVETEAYPVGDAAGHAFHGRTRRNQSLFLERGHAYVYLCYGTSFLLNVTSERPGVGGGVLLRAIEPLEGIDEMMSSAGGARRLADLGRGPGRLTRALRVDLHQDGLDLCAAGPLWLATIARRIGGMGKSVRIGITRDADRVLRFYEIGNAHVSGGRKLRQ